MTDIVERLRDPATPIVMRPKPDPLRLEAATEIERLRTRQAIQFGMHPGGDLAKATSAEIERLRAERDERTAEVARLLIEIERLRAALQQIADDATPGDDNYCSEIARRALEPKP